MTTEQRVLAALRCEQPDRVPVFVYVDPCRPDAYDPSYQDVLAAAKRHADIIHDWSFPSTFHHSAVRLKEETRPLANGDIERVLHTPAGPLTSVSRGDWRGGGTIKRWITEPEDVERFLSIPYEPVRPDLSAFLQARERGRDLWVCQVTMEDPMCMAGHIAEESLAIWTLEQRDLVRTMLAALQGRILGELEYCLKNGVGPLYYFNGPEYALPPLMSPGDFQEFVVQYDRHLIDLVHSYPGNYTIVHSHGKVSHFLESFADIGTDGLNVLEPPPCGDVNLADAKRRIGDRVCLIGNLQYDDLVRGSEAEVERWVATAIEQGASGGGFILSPCAYPYERALSAKASRNIVSYLKAGHAFGKYPLPDARMRSRQEQIS
ncbi:MAG: uroporphyrinogen decarboxylase family protein [Kiritimatiellae bacterium]|nr:uroporphyrinogen decarboxylase family protein [Kiritimatiellia bacterium]